jgi:tyrosyl-tRNA synthetase
VSEPPIEMFGKLMSISDTLMARYYLLLLGEEMPAIHPMDAKKQLARRIVERYHGPGPAQHALDDFNTRFSKRDLAHAELPTLPPESVPEDPLPTLTRESVADERWKRRSIVTLIVAAYEHCFQITKSRSYAREILKGGSVQLNGEKITDPNTFPPLKPGDVLKLDKKRAVRIG